MSPSRGIALVVLIALASCGQRTPQPTPAGKAATPPPWVPTPDGVWHWTLVSEEPGQRRVEREIWRLEARDDGLVTGTLTRTVRFESTTGVPFTCNQALRYRLEARYRLSGRLHDGGFAVRERSVSVRPSPCDPGRRRLLAYRGRYTTTGALRLVWDGGEQVLRRPAQGDATAAAASPNRPAAEPDPTPHAGLEPRSSTRTPRPRPGRAGDATPPHRERAPTVAGTWRWRGELPADARGQRRVERETWELAEDPNGVITGTLVRTVTVFDAGGEVLPCSGAPSYRYRDRYTVRGRREGRALTLGETGVEPGSHPCLQVYPRRHLDAARGRLVGDHLVLVWRGQRRQVLSRATSRPAAATPPRSAGPAPGREQPAPSSARPAALDDPRRRPARRR